MAYQAYHLAAICKGWTFGVLELYSMMWIAAHFRIPQCRPTSLNIPSSLFVKVVALAELLWLAFKSSTKSLQIVHEKKFILRMRKQNTKTIVPLDVVPERRTERFPPRFRPVGRFCEPRFRYHMRQTPFIHSARLKDNTYTKFDIYRTVF